MAYQTTGTTTGMDVFEIAITLMDELNDEGKYKHEDTEEYRNRTRSILNILIGELYLYSDTYKKNQEWPVGRRPVPELLDDLYTEIDLDDYICRSIMPYGLAAHLLLDENPSTAGFFQQRYDELKMGLMRGLPSVSEDIDDIYGSHGYYDQFGGWT